MVHQLNNNVTILQALLNTRRSPATIYPPWLRMIVTFLIPIALATTVPAASVTWRPGCLAGAAFSWRWAPGHPLRTRVWCAGVQQWPGGQQLTLFNPAAESHCYFVVWYLSAPWDRVVVGITFVLLAVFQFSKHLGIYEASIPRAQSGEPR